MVSSSSCVNRSLSLSTFVLNIGFLWDLFIPLNSSEVTHESDTKVTSSTKRFTFLPLDGVSLFFSGIHFQQWLCAAGFLFKTSKPNVCACFHLNCWCLLPRIMSFLWISPVCVLFCCRTEWDMLDEAISLKIKRNVTACVEYVCMSQEEMMCPDVVIPSNMHLWWKFRPDMDSYEYITQTEYANNIVRNNEMTCH